MRRVASHFGNPASWLLVASALFTSACGGASPPKAPNPGDSGQPPAGGERIAGSERIGWTQAGADAPAYSYTLYIDNAATALKPATCTALSSDRYDCSAALPAMSPGSHTLQLTATSGSRESERSQPIAVFVAASAQTSASSLGDAPAERTHVPEPVPDRPRMVCSVDGSLCYSVGLIAAAEDARSLTTLPDGRVLWVAGENQVFALESEGIIVPLAVDAPCEGDDAARLAALAASPTFNDDRGVFAAWICTEPDGKRSLIAVSYRELAGSLGEARAARLFDEVADRTVRMTTGPRDRLYLTVQLTTSRHVYELSTSRGTLVHPVTLTRVTPGCASHVSALRAGIFLLCGSDLSWLPLRAEGAEAPIPVANIGQGQDVVGLGAAGPAVAERLWLLAPGHATRFLWEPERRRVLEDLRLNLHSWGRLTDFATAANGDFIAILGPDAHRPGAAKRVLRLRATQPGRDSGYSPD